MGERGCMQTGWWDPWTGTVIGHLEGKKVEWITDHMKQHVLYCKSNLLCNHFFGLTTNMWNILYIYWSYVCVCACNCACMSACKHTCVRARACVRLTIGLTCGGLLLNDVVSVWVLGFNATVHITPGDKHTHSLRSHQYMIDTHTHSFCSHQPLIDINTQTSSFEG